MEVDGSVAHASVFRSFDNMFFDFGYVYDSSGKGYGGVISALVSDNSSDISSYIAEKKNSAETHFSTLYEAMLKNYE